MVYAQSIPAVAFVGRQNSGKTTLMVRLIAELSSRGVRVGTVKHHSHAGFDFDAEGKDSWRHGQAGSCFTVVAAPDKIASVQKLDPDVEMPLQRILEQMTAAALAGAAGAPDGAGPRLDVILVEGYRKSGLPTIELFRADNPKDADRPLGGEGNRIVAVVTDIPRIASEAASFEDGHDKGGIPVYGFDDIVALADFIQSAIITPCQ